MTTIHDEKIVLTDGWNYVKVVVGSNLRVEIQVKSGPLQWGKKEQGSEEVDCQALFKDYWSTTAREFPVQGQSESPIVLASLTEKVQRTLALGNIDSLWNYNSLPRSLFVCQFPTAGPFSCLHRPNLYAPRCNSSRKCWGITPH